MDPRSCLNEHEIMKKTSLLSKACSEGDKNQIQVFILKGLDLNKTDCNGNTPLFDAIRNEHSEIVEFLIQKGALVNTRNIYGTTPLSLASSLGNMHIVQCLLKNGALIDSKDPNDRNPLTFACMNGHMHIAEYLIENGANLNSKNKDGYTPLLQACLNGHKSMIELLLKSGADVNISDDFDGKTPLIILCSESRSENMIGLIELMIEKGAIVNHTSDQGLSALAAACMNGNLSSVELLIRNNADLNIHNHFCSTPLSLACFNGHKEIVRILVENGAELNIQDQEGNTALFETCSQGSKEIFDILVEHGADLNHRNKHGLTAFQLAKEQGNIEQVEFLKIKLIDTLYKLFKHTSSIRLREMVDDALNNKKTFFIQRDHIEIFKQIDVDEFSDYIHFFKSFDFQEKLIEDVLNYLKDHVELLEIGKLKIANNFPQFTKNKFRQDEKPNDLMSFEQLKELIQCENFLILIQRETNIRVKIKRLRMLIENIQVYVEIIKENIRIVNHVWDIFYEIN